MWFVIIVAGIAGLPRLLLSRRFAELQYAKLRQPKAVMRTRYMSIMILTLDVAFSVLYFTRWGHEVWVLIAIVFSLLSATDFFCQAQIPNVEARGFQHSLFGILYLAVSVASYVMLLAAEHTAAVLP